MREESLKRV